MLLPALALAQPNAGSSEGSLGLRWNDPSSLAPTSKAEFEERLSARLGRPAFGTDVVGSQTLTVSWEGAPEQCRVDLQLLRGSSVEGTRSLQSPSGDCRSLGPALLTVAALLIEAGTNQVASEPEPEPAPPTETPSPEAPVAKPVVSRAPARDREPRLWLSLGAQLIGGLAPKVELGPAAMLVLAPIAQLRVGVLGAYYFPREYGAGPGLELGHAGLGLVTCGMPLSGNLGLGVCASATVHRWASSGVSLTHPRRADTYTWSGGLSGRVEWRIMQRLWWVGSVGAELTTVPLFFYYQPAPDGRRELFAQDRVAPNLFVGLTLELG